MNQKTSTWHFHRWQYIHLPDHYQPGDYRQCTVCGKCDPSSDAEREAWPLSVEGGIVLVCVISWLAFAATVLCACLELQP